MLQSKELKRSFDENLLNDYAKNDVALKEEIQKNSDFMSNFKSTNDDCDKSVLVSQIFPKSLRSILPATFEDGDCGRPANDRPEWLDMNKFYRGQQFGLRYFCAISISLMSLPLSFSFADGLKPLILSQKSNTPYNAFKRYLSSIRRFRNWYTSDPWCEGTQAYHDIQVGLNQGDMFGTQFACMGLIVLYPEQFGIYDASDEDLEAFCHL
ncbi:hypothetical protein EAG_13524 [Camponotus floridanus]|uniref:Uncharacterized protein n=1 Tax=Camponotus floridanus TaxID=104421 RepID=E2A7P5_CAMFO|nr:hypothetical protein EAG_13524 [Camponotus floridanus]